MAFHNVRLPENIERGVNGGPNFKTTIASLASGLEKRNIDWSLAKHRFDISYGISRIQDYNDVRSFFYARRGMAHSFRFKDWSDFQLERQSQGAGTGALTTFQIFKRYTSGAASYDRPLYKPVQGTLQVWVNNVLQTETTHYTVNYNTGVITFLSPPGNGLSIEAECEFDIAARFATDEFSITLEHVKAGAIPGLEIVEVLNE